MRVDVRKGVVSGCCDGKEYDHAREIKSTKYSDVHDYRL